MIHVLIYKDDFEEWLETFAMRKCKKIQVVANLIDPENQNFNKYKSVIAFWLQKENSNSISLYIENFETFTGPLSEPNRNKGYGTFLLNNLQRRLSELGFCSKITKVFGVLDTKDITSWQYSLPMYLKFAQNIMVEDIVCLINGNPVENENMVSEAYNLNKQKIAVRFEFRRANIL